MKFVVKARDGVLHTVSGEPGFTLMEIIRNHGIDEVLALCGGCCACATCHVYVAAQFLQRLPPMSADEHDLLDSSPFRKANSRLSCQLECRTEFDGLHLEIAPEE